MSWNFTGIYHVLALVFCNFFGVNLWISASQLRTARDPVFISVREISGVRNANQEGGTRGGAILQFPEVFNFTGLFPLKAEPLNWDTWQHIVVVNPAN